MPEPMTATPPRFLSYEAAVAYCGLSVATLRRMLRDGRLRRVQPPGCSRVLIDRLQLDEVLLGSAAEGGS
jgi:excisionase family DNA binding protein